MKSAMPYFGLPSPRLKAELKPLLQDWQPADDEQWAGTVRMLWDEATHREEWYAAIAVARHRRARAWLDPASLDLWEHLIATGAWWDVVDDVATHLVGDVLAGHRSAATPLVRAWATDDDLWLRRTAVICQIGHQRRHRPRPAAARRRRERGGSLVLAAQGDRLGAPPARPDRPGLGPRRGGPAGRPAVRAVPAGGAQAPGSAIACPHDQAADRVRHPAGVERARPDHRLLGPRRRDDLRVGVRGGRRDLHRRVRGRPAVLHPDGHERCAGLARRCRSGRDPGWPDHHLTASPTACRSKAQGRGSRQRSSSGSCRCSVCWSCPSCSSRRRSRRARG